MKIHWTILMALLVVIAAGCGSIPGSPASSFNNDEPLASTTQSLPTAPAKNPIQPTQPSGTIDMPSSPPPAEKYVALAIKDLAKYLNLDAAQIISRSTMEMLWPDAALGCPGPGKVYAKGRVPGYKIWLQTGGQEYIYHTDLTGQVVLCPDVNPGNLDKGLPSSSGPTLDPNIGVPIK